MKAINYEERVRIVDGEWDVWSVINEIVATGAQEDPFYVLDIEDIINKFKQWREKMPRVEPFYAVKCNDSATVLTTLAALGTGFDCASKVEINKVLDLGVHPERIIFANPAKPASHIRHAAATGVSTMTFDSETELMKVKQLYPTAKLVVRIRCDALVAQCQLGMKFGCDPSTEAPKLLKQAAVLGLEVVGVSFHVGSGCGEPGVFARAIAHARTLFDEGARLGHSMQLLDIGGGYPGNRGTSIDEIATVVNAALALHFPDPAVRVVSEPGRYFVASAYTLVCNVHSKRQLLSPIDDSVEHTMFFINDGVYGSFNCILYDHQEITTEPLKASVAKLAACSVWGPTCDGLDCVIPTTRLPVDTCAGDWLVFRDMGAYTLPVASPFNGFPLPAVRAIADRRVWSVLKDLQPFTEEHWCFGGPMTGPQVHEDADSPMWPTPPATPPLAAQPTYVECALK